MKKIEIDVNNPEVQKLKKECAKLKLIWDSHDTCAKAGVLDIVATGKKKFTEIKYFSELSSRVIIKTLDLLIEEKMVTTEVPDPSNPAIFDYLITDKGRKMIPLIKKVVILIDKDTQDALDKLKHEI